MAYGQSVLIAALACALAACGSTTDNGSGQPSATVSVSPTPTVTVLDEEMAGERYMTIICPANAAGDKWRLLADDVYLDSVISPEYRKQTKELAAAYKKAARQLVDSDYEWPPSVAPSIERVAEEYYGDSASLTDHASEDTVTTIDWHSSGKSADRIRLRLGLPPAGTGCKKYVG